MWQGGRCFGRCKGVGKKQITPIVIRKRKLRINQKLNRNVHHQQKSPSPSHHKPSLNPSTLQPQRVLPRLLLPPQGLPIQGLRPLLLLRGAAAHASHLAECAAAPHHAANHGVDHAPNGLRDCLQPFANGVADGGERGLDLVTGGVAVGG